MRARTGRGLTFIRGRFQNAIIELFSKPYSFQKSTDFTLRALKTNQS